MGNGDRPDLPRRRRNAPVRLLRPARQPRGARYAAALHGFVFRLGPSSASGLCDGHADLARQWRLGPKLGLDDAAIRDVNRQAIAFARDLRGAHPWRDHILIEGVLGPAGDGYAPEQLLTPIEAAGLHSVQLETFAEEGVDIASAFTITHPGEAIGMVNRARELGLPFALSFTVETDGRLPTGQDLDSALSEVEAATGGYARYYGINCAHPQHFGEQLPARWLDRIGMVRPNASRRSHAELDEATELDDGDPQEFGALCAEMAKRLPGLRVVGGCCGSDIRHIKALLAAGV